MNSERISSRFALLALFFMPAPKTAFAYIGPGAGSGGASIGITGLIIVTVIALIGLGLACAVIAAIVKALLSIRRALARKSPPNPRPSQC